MKISCEERDNAHIMHLKGEFVAEEVERFQQHAQQRFELAQGCDFVLDCSELEFVDSQGLEAMIWLQERCTEQLGQMRLAGCSENVRSILDITRLGSRFECHEAVDTAVTSLR